MKYPKLEDPCKSCLGCQRLENPNFTGDKNCKYAEKEIKYQDCENEEINIIFYKKYKVITGCPTYDYFLDMDILQAINEKVKELGWNE